MFLFIAVTPAVQAAGFFRLDNISPQLLSSEFCCEKSAHWPTCESLQACSQCNNILHKNSVASRAERVSWREAFYGFCMSLNVAFLALVYYPAAAEGALAEVDKKLLFLQLAQFSHPALRVLNVQRWKNFGKMEKCKRIFFVNDWLKVLDINQAETGGDFWNFDPFQTAFIEINTEPGLSRVVSVSNICWCTGHFCNSSVCPCKQVFLEKQRLFCSHTMHHVSLANFKTFGFLLYHNPTWTDIFLITRNSTLCAG